MQLFPVIAVPWIRVGANVLPIAPGAKKPAVDGWGERGDGPCLHSPDSPKVAPEVLAGWIRQFGDLNVAVLPGSIGATVVDVDDLSRLDDVLDACGPTTYRTTSGRDGGGVHLWYSGTTRCKTGICRGVDLKSTGGYVLAPGSIHHATGRPYVASPALAAALTDGALVLPEPRHGWRDALRSLDTELRDPRRIDAESLAGRWRNNPANRPFANALAAVVKGDAFAAHGERDSVLFRLLQRLAEEWPHARTESIVALFEASAEVMEAAHPVEIPIVEAVASKWERLREDVATVEAEGDDRSRAQRRLAWSWVEVESDEPAAVADGPIVLHTGRSFWIRVGSQWVGPWVRDDLTPDALGALGALYGVELGDIPGTLAAFGARPARVVHSLACRSSTYDRARNELTVATAPIRSDLVPEYSAAVDAVLGEIGGEYAGQLRWWLAGLVRPDLPCRALVLSGARGRGKSLLLSGISRLWRGGAGKMRDVLGRRFNASITQSYLALADDDTSPAESGEALAVFLREGVSDRVQRLERKHHDVTTVEGCMRYAIATNDPFALVQGAVSYRLNQASLEAFGDRLLHVPVPDSAVDCWVRAGTTGDVLVEGDAIARHVLWLGEMFATVGAIDRFWVGAGDQELARLAVLSSGLRGDVLLRIADSLDGAPAHGIALGDRSGWLSVGNGTVRVLAKALLGRWGSDAPRGATARTVAQACKALAEASRCEQPPYAGGGRTHEIDLDLVEWYRERSGA